MAGVMAGEDAGSRFAVGAMSGDFLIGLRQHSVYAGDRFDPRRYLNGGTYPARSSKASAVPAGMPGVGAEVRSGSGQ